MNLSKEKQLGRYKRKQPAKKGVDSEAALQSFTDGYLNVRRIYNFRIPDNFWNWIQYACQKLQAWGKLKELRYRFGGIADNTCFIPISDKYSLAIHLELKSKRGQLHGKQKVQAKVLPWQIARDHKEVMAIVEAFEQEAKRLRDAS